MKKLLNIELQKIIPYPVFWIILGVHGVLYILVSTVGSQVDFNIQPAGFDFHRYFEFPIIWNTFTWLASWFNLILAILIIVLTGNEFTFKTFRQQVIDGLHRYELINSKLIIVFLIALWSVVLVFITTLIFGVVNSQGIDMQFVFTKSYFILVYFVQTLCYMAFALLFSLIFKNTALSIVLYLLWFPFEGIIRFFIPDVVSDYFPMKVISKLTPNPKITDAMDADMQVAIEQNNAYFNMPVEEKSIGLMIGISIAYLFLFILLSHYLIKRRNL